MKDTETHTLQSWQIQFEVLKYRKSYWHSVSKTMKIMLLKDYFAATYSDKNTVITGFTAGELPRFLA